MKIIRKYHYNEETKAITYTQYRDYEENQDVKAFRDDLMSFIKYDPKTGRFTKILKQKGDKLIKINKPLRMAKYGNYQEIEFKGRRYQAHRLAWLIHYGEWPKQIIDHINRLKNDNRIENLRDVSYSENNKNSPRFD